MDILINEDVLREIEKRAIVRAKRIEIPPNWRLNYTFAFSVDLVVVDDQKDKKDIKRIPLYRLQETIFGTLKHEPYISTVFKHCKIGKGSNMTLDGRFTYVSRTGRKIEFLHIRKRLPDGRILELKDLFWNWLVVKANSDLNGCPYSKLEDYIQKRMLELGFTDADEGVRRQIVAWFTALSIALGMIKIVIPKEVYIPLGCIF